MTTSFQKSCYVASTALSMSLIAGSAQAYSYLPNLTNLDFTEYTGTAPKGSFAGVDPTGWTGGTGLIFIDSTSGLNEQAASPVYLTTYGNPAGSYSGNYVEADGNPHYESGFDYTVTGLTPGEKYSLSFYQGASEQVGFGYNNYVDAYTPTTNQWIVALGASGLTLDSGGPTNLLYGPTDTYSDADPDASIVASPLMTVCYQCTVGWDYVTMTLTADATADVLSFLAYGDDGSTVNLPPIAFLAGVNSPAGLGVPAPEPASMTLFAVGLLGLGGIARRHRKKSSRSG
ncbi:MAG: PEP-CTERM sorting domain-containing protein [Terriglobales bacterium]